MKAFGRPRCELRALQCEREKDSVCAEVASFLKAGFREDKAGCPALVCSALRAVGLGRGASGVFPQEGGPDPGVSKIV